MSKSTHADIEIAQAHVKVRNLMSKAPAIASKDHAHQSHPDIVKRLKRAEGHIRSVIAMFGDGRSCLDLAQQLYAVEKAISEARRRLIHDHVDHCLHIASNGRGVMPAAAVDEFKAITRFL